MKLPRPRFTVRWLMAVVAIAAGSIPAATEGRRLAMRSRHNREWAALHRNSEDRSLADSARLEAEIARCKDPAAVLARWKRSGLAEDCRDLFIRDDAQLLQRAGVSRRMAAHHAEMRRRFERATYLPWRPVVEEPAPGWGP